MVRWITNSRLRTAFAILFFVAVLLLSSFLAVLGSWGLHQDYSAIPVIIGLVTAAVSLIGIISTLVFAWRADRRMIGEPDRKLCELHKQISELQRKLENASAG
jgi:uncharacterized membrane protein (DUF106 family)